MVWFCGVVVVVASLARTFTCRDGTKRDANSEGGRGGLGRIKNGDCGFSSCRIKFDI